MEVFGSNGDRNKMCKRAVMMMQRSRVMGKDSMNHATWNDAERVKWIIQTRDWKIVSKWT